MICFRYGFEALYWQNAIKESQNVYSEFKRTKNGIIKYNMKMFYQPEFLINMKLVQKQILSILKPFFQEKGGEKISSSLAKIPAELDFLCDAFYSYKPVHFDIFKQAVIYFHLSFRNELINFWNDNFNTASAKTCLEIALTYYGYVDILKQWQITETTFTMNDMPYIETFFASFFDNSKETIYNIICEITTNAQISDGKIILSGMDSFEGHVSFIIDHYRQMNSNLCAREIIRYISSLLSLMLITFNKMFEKNDYEINIVIGMMNSSFLKILKNAMKKLIDLSRKTFELKQLKWEFNERFLVRQSVKLLKTCQQKLKKKISQKIKISIFQNNDFSILNFENVIKDNLRFMEKTLNLLLFVEDKSDLFQLFFTKIVKNYIYLFAESRRKMTELNMSMYYLKVSQDFEVFQKFCTPELVKEPDLIIKNFQHFYNFLNTCDLDKMLISLLNINLFCKNLSKSGALHNLVEAKIFLPKESENFLISHFEVKPVSKAIIPMYKLNKRRKMMFLHISLILYFYYKLSFLKRNKSQKRKN